MIRRFGLLGIAAIFIFASGAFAQYTMDLTGVGDGVTFDGVYVSPYQGTIQQGNTTIYTGYMICDDFTTESFLNSPWNATGTTAAAGNGKFAGDTYSFMGKTYNSQQMYDAVAYLATQLMINPTGPLQTDLSFAMWDIMDQSLNVYPDVAETQTLITQAFAAGAVDAANVDVFTASPNNNVSQEFLVVNGPRVTTPEPSSAALLGFDLASVVGLFFLLRRYRKVRA